MKKKQFGIYIHIPFCMSKCSYCSFISKCASKEEIHKYFNALNLQIELESKKFKNKIVTSIYFGGGTPSFVNHEHIVECLNTIKKHYKLDKYVEITIECNPCSTTTEKLIAYKNAGINRISFGVQSLNNNCLKIIGRKHNHAQAIKAVKLAQKCDFANISCDLLIGIPNQTSQMLLNDINLLVKLGVNHISAYMLMLEENTKLYEQVVINKTLGVADDDLCIDMYNKAYSILQSLGFNRYEISNFAKSGFECKHNINYWEMGEYVGFGLAAHSFYNNTRISGFNTFEDYYDYINCLGKQDSQVNEHITCLLKENIENLTTKQLIEETLMLGLRQQKGVSIKALNNLGYNILQLKQTLLNNLIENNVIEIKNNYIRIKENMFGACNQIILNLLP
ncbi:MAG: radical SAM family heme chaperone HemW [Clostridiales bacterium]|nr:radical SAM family heme chaperone HemW [Clostridiales bacterium]